MQAKITKTYQPHSILNLPQNCWTADEVLSLTPQYEPVSGLQPHLALTCFLDHSLVG